VDEVQVDVVDTEPFEASLRLGGGVLACGVKLRGDEHLLARYTTAAEGLPDAFFVAVGLGSVDVSIAELERPQYSVDTLRAVGNLPNAETQDRDPVAICQKARALL
jgi:hypothetical protein